MRTSRVRLPFDYYMLFETCINEKSVESRRQSHPETLAIASTVLPQVKAPVWGSFEKLHPAKDVKKRPSIPSALEPKVFLQFQDEPQKVPRRIEIERRKTEFQAQSLSKLLEKEGVSVLDEATFALAVNDGKHINFSTQVPLEEFDDTEFEERSIDTWIKAGDIGAKVDTKQDIAVLLPVNYFSRGNWLEAHVVGYNYSSGLWKIKTDTEERNVSRIHICFKAENPFVFAKRYATAVFRACLAKQEISLPVSATLISKIERLNPYKLRNIPREADFVQVDVQQRIKDFKKRHLYARSEVFYLTVDFRQELAQNILEIAKVDFHAFGVLEPADFQTCFKKKCVEISKQLNNEWSNKVIAMIIERLTAVGHGWFNVNESDLTVYQMSKLSNLMVLYRLMMQDKFREIISYSQGRVVTAISTMQSSNGPDFKLAIFRSEPIIDGEYNLKFDSDKELCGKIIETMVDDYIGAFDGVLNLEHAVLKKILWSSRSYVKNVSKDEHFVTVYKRTLAKFLELNFQLIESMLARIDHKERIKVTKDQFLQVFEESLAQKSVQDLEEEISKLQEEEAKILSDIPVQVAIGFFVVDMVQVRTAVTKEWGNVIVSVLQQKAVARLQNLNSRLGALIEKITSKPENVEAILELREILAKSGTDSLAFKAEIEDVLQTDTLMKRFNFDVSQEFTELVARSAILVQQLSEKSEERKSQLKGDESNLLKLFKAEREVFLDKIRLLGQTVADFNRNVDIVAFEENETESQAIAHELEQCQNRAIVTNSREKLFDILETDFSSFFTVVSGFEPVVTLWKLAKTWKDAKNGATIKQLHDFQTGFAGCKSNIHASLPQYVELASKLGAEIEAAIKEQE